MSLDKAIKHGKEKRKQYRGSKAFDYSCRHGGSCDYCRRNRMSAARKVAADAKLKEE
jgi:hypothetical protein